MALTERNRQNGWRHQAAGLVTKHTALGTTAMAAVEQNRPLLKREKAAPQASEVEFDFKLAERRIGPANERGEARTEIARLERALSQEAEVSRTLREPARVSAAERDAVTKRADRFESELGAARIQLQGELDLTTAANARLTESLVERGAALDNARARIEFLETALSAAEAECSRLAAEIGGASERHRIESDALRSLIEAASSRAVTAATLLAEAKQRLNARSAENDAAEQRLAEATQRLHARSAETGAAEQRLAEAKAAYNEADSKNRQLQKSLGLRQRQVEELEQSRLTLIDATNALLETFQDRDRALTCAEETIKSLTERNAQLEAKLDFIESHDEIHRPDTPLRALDDADEGTRKEWAELARHLATLVKLKRRSSGPAHGRSLTLLAGTVTL